MNRHSPQAVQGLRNTTAREISAREGITFAVALQRVIQNGKMPLTEMKRRAALMANPLPTRVFASTPLHIEADTPPASVPPLPTQPITLTKVALEYLSKVHPLWDRMNLDQRFTAALALRNMGAMIGVQLSAGDGRPLALLCLYPGNTKTERARSFLLATEPGFGQLNYDQQFQRTVKLHETHRIADFAQGGAT